MSAWQNFNDAEQQASFDLIPAKTLAKVRLTLKPGGYDNPHFGWTGGYATRNTTTGSVYLSAEFVVLEGTFARRKVWSLIGLHSEKGPEWANMGRAFLRAVLNSARGVHPDDASPTAQAARCIQSFADLDGLEFVARIDVERDAKGEDRNVIHTALQPGHKDYAAQMGAGGFRAPASGLPAVPAGFTASPAPAATASPASGPAAPFRPSWAE
ncbi:hypothetical protein EWI61_04790 [Methylolobus aquaticus]|nr:hypothetical protein EWI61_04790 [Methylolobus aquaticus]